MLVNGDFKVLLANDASGVVAYGRKTLSQAAIVIINRSDDPQSGPISVAGYLPDGVVLNQAYAVGTGSGGSLTVTGGQVTGQIGPWSAVLFLSGTVDLQPPAAPANLQVTDEGNAQVSLAWEAVNGAVRAAQ